MVSHPRSSESLAAHNRERGVGGTDREVATEFEDRSEKGNRFAAVLAFTRLQHGGAHVADSRAGFGAALPFRATAAGDGSDRAGLEWREILGRIVGAPDVSFEIEQGELFVVIGLPGIVKSTLNAPDWRTECREGCGSLEQRLCASTTRSVWICAYRRCSAQVMPLPPGGGVTHGDSRFGVDPHR
jgi:hypothetical protein